MEQLEANGALIISLKKVKLKEKHLNKSLDRTEIAYRPRKILHNNIYDIFKTSTCLMEIGRFRNGGVFGTTENNLRRVNESWELKDLTPTRVLDLLQSKEID